MRGKFLECVSKSLMLTLTTRTPASTSRRAISSLREDVGPSAV